jgi:Na+/phosphate symporter
MKPLTKTEQIVVCISCFVVMFTLVFLFFSVQGIRRAGQIQRRQEQKNQQMSLLMEQSLELSQQASAELWKVIEENRAIAEELKKSEEQRAADIELRQKKNAERAESVQRLLDQQQRLNEQIRALNEQNGIAEETVSPETKALLEKY